MYPLFKRYNGFCVDIGYNVFNERRQTITPYLGTDGYMHIRRRDGEKIIYMRLHQLIAKLYVPNPNGYSYVNHIDSNKTNNLPSNLEWCTNSQNVYHGWHSGNRTHHNNTHVTVYTSEGLYVNTYTSIRKLSEDLNLDRHKVARILKGEVKNNYPYEFSYAE